MGSQRWIHGLSGGRFGLFCACAATLGVCAVLLLRGGAHTETPDREAPPADQRVPVRDADDEPVRSARRQPSRAVPAGGDDAAATPGGYSVVGSRGAMSTAPVGGAEPAATRRSREAVPDWMASPGRIAALATQAAAAGRDWTFGWVLRSPDSSAAQLERSLERLDVAVLGGSGRFVRAKLPGSTAALRMIAALPEVAGIGTIPPEAKTAAFDTSEGPGGRDPVPAFVTLMADDADRRWGRELQGLGVALGRYDPDLRVYAVELPLGAVDAVADADYVLGVEPIRAVHALHDTAMPAMGADALRRWDDGIRAFRGPAGFPGRAGADVPVGVMDTGLNIAHADISSGRRSICGANLHASSPGRGDGDLWRDRDGHGTHVTGTLLGNGAGNPTLAGVAPLVRDLRFAKVLGDDGSGTDESVRRGMDYLARATECGQGGSEPARVRPLLVSASLGKSSLEFSGRSVIERKLDAVVWRHGQLYVVAQSNEGAGGFSDMGAAKNSLAVGAAEDAGDLAFFSSLGPTADGRLAPNVVGVGVSVRSALGDGRRTGYVAYDGTSMATPAVAGVAALLMDAAPDFRGQPALARARLMASAIKPDAFLGDAGFRRDNTRGPGELQNRYGLGKVSARTTVLNRDAPDGWSNASTVTEPFYGSYGYFDIDVPEHASRLDFVLTWDEPPADTVTPSVLNDLDLWMDRDGDCDGAACGEFVSRSRIDNVEWLIVSRPAPGRYRVKVVPHRLYTAAPRAAVAGTIIRGPSTPRLRVEVEDADVRVAQNGRYSVAASVTVDGYVAAGTVLRIDCRAAPGSWCPDDLTASRPGEVSREDGLLRTLEEDLARGGSVIGLGEVGAGETQRIELSFSRQPSPHAFRLFLTASAWNAVADSASVAVSIGDAHAAPPDAAARPRNDDFAVASHLRSAEGDAAFDLMLATADPGEPPLDEVETAAPGPDLPFVPTGRPARSVWYVWQAPESGTQWFGVDASIGGGATVTGDVRIDVYRGTRVAALKPVASGTDSVTFAAEAGRTYRVRLAAMDAPGPRILRWSRVAPPPNDGFALAEALAGETGTVEGTTVGATLDPGEFLGALAGTTWYRWTAPLDGDWFFGTNRRDLRVVAVSGDDPAALRLVSGNPDARATFPARQGQELRIAVALPDAERPGARYVLSWGRAHDRVAGNDDLAAAESIAGDGAAADGEAGDGAGQPSSFLSRYDTDATVEPGEHAATGTRTRWWTWTAPADGDHTWLVDWIPGSSQQPFDPVVDTAPPPVPLVEAAVFEAAGGNDLALAAWSQPDRARAQFTLNAREGRRYAISLGISRDGAFDDYGPLDATFTWGPTPPNDDLADASALAGAEGRVAGSLRLATLERGETGAGLGSLWWTWEAPAAAWYRFALDQAVGDGLIAVYREDAQGGRELVAQNDPWSRLPEAVFRAEAGVRYTVRLASHADPFSYEFALDWEETEPPVWMRYAGRVVDGELNGDAVLDLWRPGDLAVGPTDGGVLYAATRLGLVAFSRDADTGSLTWVETRTEGGTDDNTRLLWDPHRDRLYTKTHDAWHAFSPRAEPLGLDYEHELALDVAAEASFGQSLLLDSEGTFLHAVDGNAGRLVTWAFGDDGDGLLHVETVHVDGLRDAVIGTDDAYLYAGTRDSLLVFDRDAETGSLDQVRTVPLASGNVGLDGYDDLPTTEIRAITLAGDGQHLFVVSDGDVETRMFTLEADPSDPQLLATLPPFGERPDGSPRRGCRAALPRRERTAVDVFCASAGYSVVWRSETYELAPADYIAHWQADRFDNEIPDFGTPRNVVLSPAGTHVYASGENDEILIVERIGSR